MATKKPVWNVYIYDQNRREFKPYNVMDYLYPIIKKLRKKDMSKEEYLKELKIEAMAMYWSRSEYEMVLKPWIFGKNDKEIKIDVYDQLMLNWDRFSDYCWSLYI